MKKCISCDKKLTGKQQKYCSNICKCKQTNVDAWPRQKARYIKLKKELIKSFNSACTECGYNKNLSALCFHHLDSSKKEFKLDTRGIGTRSKKKILEEVEKCILLCSNCHQELHNPDMAL